MAEQQVDERLMKADRWSKVIALFFAMGMYGLGMMLTENITFNAAVAAFAAVGVRISIPYYVGVSEAGLNQVPSQAHPDAGKYHHGAVGGALILGSFVALAAMSVEPSTYPAFGSGIATGIVSFLLLRVVLPSE